MFHLVHIHDGQFTFSQDKEIAGGVLTQSQVHVLYIFGFLDDYAVEHGKVLYSTLVDVSFLTSAMFSQVL